MLPGVEQFSIYANLVDPVVATNPRYTGRYQSRVLRPLANREIAAVVVVDSIEHQTDWTECEYLLHLPLHSHGGFGFAPGIVKYGSRPWSSHGGFENPVTPLAKFCKPAIPDRSTLWWGKTYNT